MRYFQLSEFDSPDEPGSGRKYMDLSFLSYLDQLREKCGFEFKVNSGYRTLAHNEEVLGEPASAHTKGLAADIAIKGSRERFIFVEEALKIGFRRIGIAKTFIHIDIDGSKDQEVIWLY